MYKGIINIEGLKGECTVEFSNGIYYGVREFIDNNRNKINEIFVRRIVNSDIGQIQIERESITNFTDFTFEILSGIEGEAKKAFIKK